jgi:Mg2+/citrate symporter
MAPFEFSAPILTRQRVRLAYVIAVTADVAQLLLGPLGWAGADQVIDVAAMLALWRVIGFHPLLLPTFVLEALPVADVLPTWSGCVALVLAFRRREPAHVNEPDAGPFIDV